MNPDKDIKHILSDSPGLALDAKEKALMKTALLQYAEKTLAREKAVVSPWNYGFTRAAIGVTTFLLLIGGTTFAAKDSLPGDSLYAVKVNVIEEAVAKMKLDPYVRANYELGLMETRLLELKTLQQENVEVSPEDLTILAEQITEHIADVTNAFENASETEVPFIEKIDTLAKISSLARAQSQIADDHDQFTTISATLENSEEDAADNLYAVVETFAEEQSTAVVNEYLRDQITEVGHQVTASSTESAIREAATHHLHGVEESLAEGDAAEAIMSIIYAQQEIVTSEYLANEDLENQETK